MKNPINSADSQEKIFKVALPVSLEAVFQTSLGFIDQIIVGTLRFDRYCCGRSLQRYRIYRHAALFRDWNRVRRLSGSGFQTQRPE